MSTYQQLYALCIKNKVLESCNTNLVTFLLERDPSLLADLNKLVYQYCAAHLPSKYRKKLPFKPLLVKVVASFPRKKLKHTQHTNFLVTSHNIKGGRGIGRITTVHSNSEQRPNPTKQHNPPERKFRDYSNTKGCHLCGSWWHDIMNCPYKRRDDFDKCNGSGQNKGDKRSQDCFWCDGPHVQCICRRYKQAVVAEGYTESSRQQQQQCRP